MTDSPSRAWRPGVATHQVFLPKQNVLPLNRSEVQIGTLQARSDFFSLSCSNSDGIVHIAYAVVNYSIADASQVQHLPRPQ
jgi:hypothetical protein